jgi:hypothetical protein
VVPEPEQVLRQTVGNAAGLEIDAEVIVPELGAIGANTALRLAEYALSVIGIDRFMSDELPEVEVQCYRRPTASLTSRT